APRPRSLTWRRGLPGRLGQLVAAGAAALIVAGVVFLRLHAGGAGLQGAGQTGIPTGTKFCTASAKHLTSRQARRVSYIMVHRVKAATGRRVPVQGMGAGCVHVGGKTLHGATVRMLGAVGSVTIDGHGGGSLAPGTVVEGNPPCVVLAAHRHHLSRANCRVRLETVVTDGEFKKGSARPVGTGRGENRLLTFGLTHTGSVAWCRYTSRHVHRGAAFVLDGRVISDPTIVGAICSGGGVFPVGSRVQARMIAAYLNYGPLPVRFVPTRL
ncbi:MAG: SecDF P1 head subdomain-containing protein, partial [Chloroflexota bacterium]